MRHRPDLRSHEITPKDVWEARRRFMKGALAGAGVLALGPLCARGAEEGPPRPRLEGSPSPLSTGEKKTPYEDVTTYNNFYELGTSKEAPARNARRLRTDPWSISVDGECLRPGRVGVEDLLDRPALEERIYRLRCVEGWSMVIPWIGLPLSKVLARFQPSSHAKYVAFETLLDPERLPGQRRPVLEWPYREGLRLDEASHPLTLLAFGLYGEVLPPQNGAPLRLVVPWKYGFKSIKSIVGIRFTREQPPTAWNLSAPSEYGFYANVNPEVDHPRWSQKTERRLGEWRRRPTLPFNGYADQVASLYTGLDLRRYY